MVSQASAGPEPNGRRLSCPCSRSPEDICKNRDAEQCFEDCVCCVKYSLHSRPHLQCEAAKDAILASQQLIVNSHAPSRLQSHEMILDCCNNHVVQLTSSGVLSVMQLTKYGTNLPTDICVAGSFTNFRSLSRNYRLTLINLCRVSPRPTIRHIMLTYWPVNKNI